MSLTVCVHEHSNREGRGRAVGGKLRQVRSRISLNGRCCSAADALRRCSIVETGTRKCPFVGCLGKTSPILAAGAGRMPPNPADGQRRRPKPAGAPQGRRRRKAPCAASCGAQRENAPRARNQETVTTAVIASFAKESKWCGREDSNFHGSYPTATSTLRVYQFRHDRTVVARLIAKALGDEKRNFAGISSLGRATLRQRLACTGAAPTLDLRGGFAHHGDRRETGI